MENLNASDNGCNQERDNQRGTGFTELAAVVHDEERNVVAPVLEQPLRRFDRLQAGNYAV
jgi:hypothetical protein